MRIVAISPHSDDAELGLGGYMASASRRKGVVTDVYLVAKDSVSFTKAQHGVDRETRLTEGDDARKQLYFNLIPLDAARDGQFDLTPRSQLVKTLESVFYGGQRVDELYIPLPSFHQDHTTTYEACIAALRPRAVHRLPLRVYAYEYPGQAWGPAPPPSGKVYKAISGVDLDAKVNALKAHTTQWVSVPNAPMVGEQAVRGLAMLRGSEAMVDFAEMFYLMRQIDV